MTRKPFIIATLLISMFVLQGCFIFGPVSKQDRIVKRNSSDLRKKEIVLYARYEGTQTGTHLKIRKEKLFDLFTHTAFGWSYYSGNWDRLNDSDTIVLSYSLEHETKYHYAVVNGDVLSLETEFLDSINKKSWKFEIVHNNLE